MKRLTIAGMILMGLLFSAPPVSATPLLCDWAFNINGELFTAPDPGQLPDYVDYSGFDWNAGLGTITMTYNPAVHDNYFLISFFDHEFDEPINTFFNEYGTANGTPSTGQSWEIDEPGYSFGDIYDNVLAGSLDNSNSVPEGAVDDVSMALGWDFFLASNETALINFVLSEDIPADTFYLSHTDPDSNERIYFSSSIDIQPVPEPATLFLVGTGLVGFFSLRRKWLKK